MLEITSDPIDLERVRSAIASEKYGGIVIFEGVVRADEDGERRIVALEYEAHVAMAIHEFERIAAEVCAQSEAIQIAIVHRVGRLAVGESAVVVAVGAPHRDQAFSACRFAIDELKAHAQIWKREHFTDGSTSWRANDCSHDELT